MYGSEKQVKWANELRVIVDDAISKKKDEFGATGLTPPLHVETNIDIWWKVSDKIRPYLSGRNPRKMLDKIITSLFILASWMFLLFGAYYVYKSIIEIDPYLIALHQNASTLYAIMAVLMVVLMAVLSNGIQGRE